MDAIQRTFLTGARICGLVGLCLITACGTPETSSSSPELAELPPAPSFLRPTSADVHGLGCASGVEAILEGDFGEFLNENWEIVGALALGDGRVVSSYADLVSLLDGSTALERERTALLLNLTLNDMGLFGQFADIGSAQLVTGPLAGLTARELLATQAAVAPSAYRAAFAAFNNGFSGRPSSWGYGVVPDFDGDGVPGMADCDDTDASIGQLLYTNDFDSDDGFFETTSSLSDPWSYSGSSVSPTAGGQQVFLGQTEEWDNVVVFADLDTSVSDCMCEPGEQTDRWRGGILLRAFEDEDQDEGFSGYRCALSSNAQAGCYEPGTFLQLAEFMDIEEDGIPSECVEDCPANNSFDQLDRNNHCSGDLTDSDEGSLAFWAVGDDLFCEATMGNGDTVQVASEDDSFSAGTVGMSTLNLLGDFQGIKVCEAYEIPSYSGGEHEECEVSDTTPVSVTLTADDAWTAYLDGVQLTNASYAGSWSASDTFEWELESGEHTLAVHAADVARVISGFLATVSVDGTVVHATGDGSFAVTGSQPASDWMDGTFDDSAWSTASECSSAATWGTSYHSDMYADGASWVWSSANCLSLGESWFRVTFEVP